MRCGYDKSFRNVTAVLNPGGVYHTPRPVSGQRITELVPLTQNPRSVLRPLLFFLCLSSAAPAVAQDTATTTPEIKEIGLLLTGLTDFGFIYKSQVSADRFWRARLASFNFSVAGAGNGQTVSNVAVGLAVGVERRRRVSGRFFFHHGPEPRASLVGQLRSGGSQYRIGLGLGYVLGFQLAVSDRFVVGLETIPGLDLTYTLSARRPNLLGLNAGFSTNAVALTGTYRFVPDRQR